MQRFYHPEFNFNHLTFQLSRQGSLSLKETLIYMQNSVNMETSLPIYFLFNGIYFSTLFSS